MLSVFPRILFLSQLSPFLIRITLGFIFVFWAYRIFKAKKNQTPTKLLGLLEGVVGILLIIGLWTQLAALVAAIELAFLLGQKVSKRAFLTDGVNYYLVLFILAVSLLFTGAGFFAFDLPL